MKEEEEDEFELEKEEEEFKKRVEEEGEKNIINVEEWLSNLAEIMAITVKESIKNCFFDWKTLDSNEDEI